MNEDGVNDWERGFEQYQPQETTHAFNDERRKGHDGSRTRDTD